MQRLVLAFAMLPLVGAMILSGALGTWLGVRLLHRIPTEKI